MRLRLAIVIAVLFAGAGGVVIALLATGGDDATVEGSVLSWEEDPLVFTPPDLPTDQVAYGTVRNSSLDRLQAANGDFVVRDAGGQQLDASIQFLGTYAHGLYGAFQKPDPLPDEERSRLGFTVDLQTGQTSPLTVSYRLADDSELPATLYYKDVPALELPEG